jgi:hypothetical protein
MNVDLSRELIFEVKFPSQAKHNFLGHLVHIKLLLTMLSGLCKSADTATQYILITFPHNKTVCADTGGSMFSDRSNPHCGLDSRSGH